MKTIISGTDRPGSRTLEVCKIVQSLFKAEGEDVEIIDLRTIGMELVSGTHYGSDAIPDACKNAIAKVTASDGLVVVCPEYNGSMPGILKYFIDFWIYPDTFEYRPVAFIGLGGRFGGLRPVEHLQGVFGYRNSYCYPERVFLTDIFKNLKDGKIEDPRVMGLLTNQIKGFRKFVTALQSQGLDANSILKARAEHQRE